MSTTSDLLEGIAWQLHNAGIGVYRPDGVYQSTDIGIVMKNIPVSPDRVIILNTYTPGNTDDVDQPLGTVAVQFRYRGRPNRPLDTDESKDAVFDLIQGQEQYRYGTVQAISVARFSSMPMGQDGSKRHEHVDNYYIDVETLPTIHRQ